MRVELDIQRKRARIRRQHTKIFENRTGRLKSKGCMPHKRTKSYEYGLGSPRSISIKTESQEWMLTHTARLAHFCYVSSYSFAVFLRIHSYSSLRNLLPYTFILFPRPFWPTSTSYEGQNTIILQNTKKIAIFPGNP